MFLCLSPSCVSPTTCCHGEPWACRQPTRGLVSDVEAGLVQVGGGPMLLTRPCDNVVQDGCLVNGRRHCRSIFILGCELVPSIFVPVFPFVFLHCGRAMIRDVRGEHTIEPNSNARTSIAGPKCFPLIRQFPCQLCQFLLSLSLALPFLFRFRFGLFEI